MSEMSERDVRESCDNFLYGFKGTPSGRASRAEARLIPRRTATR